MAEWGKVQVRVRTFACEEAWGDERGGGEGDSTSLQRLGV